jgi:CpeT protein
MNRSLMTTFCMLALGTVACGSSEDDPAAPHTDAGVDALNGSDVASEDGDTGEAAAETGADGDSDTPEASAPQADALLAAYLTGRFDSEAQSKEDPSYFAIQLMVCAVDVPELGGRVLYVEQARLEQATTPYRQRLYVIEPLDPPATRAVSRVFELDDPSAAVGLCDDPSKLVLTAADAVEKEGCGVEMEWKGDHFEGGTVGKECVSTLSGASYTSSEVNLTDTTMTSWDRGFDANDVQVWGATKGPYVFDRKTPLEPVAP